MVEGGIPRYVSADLSTLGHDLIPAEYPLGNALSIEYGPGGETSRFTGTADPRGGGFATGY